MKENKINNKLYQHLTVLEDPSHFSVYTGTYKFRFNKNNGLIDEVQALTIEQPQILRSAIPDLYISNSDDVYFARFETNGECDIIYESPTEVRIRSHGIYHSSSHVPLPIRYRITYDIKNDGTMFIIVDNKAYEACRLEKVCISKGSLDSSFCRYYLCSSDLSTSEVLEISSYGEISYDKSSPEQIFNGSFIPWFFFGNDCSSVEVHVLVQPYLGYQPDHVGSGSFIHGFADADSVWWEVYSKLDREVSINAGWEHTFPFALSFAPSRVLVSSVNEIRACLIDLRNDFERHKIEALGIQGYNMVIGNLNLDDQKLIDEFVDACHSNGLKAVPYVSIMKTINSTRLSETTIDEWLIHPKSNDRLICPGATGHRDEWMKDLEEIIGSSDFDGLYLDLDYSRLACKNTLHGCSRYLRPTIIWAREMAKFAYTKAKEKSVDYLVLMNVDPMLISFIFNWSDICCVCKSTIVRSDLKPFYNQRRIGRSLLPITIQGG